MVNLLALEVAQADCPLEFILVEDQVSAVRRDPQIEEQVDDGLERRWIRILPPHRLENIGVVSRPGSVRSVEAADIKGSILKEKPHTPVTGVQYGAPEVLHGL